MPPSQFHYLPLSPAFFSLLVGILVAVVVLIQLGVLRYAYIRLGVGARPALVLLFASLIGSYINIPIAALPAEQLMSGRDVIYFLIDIIWWVALLCLRGRGRGGLYST